jgi:hypothetical protein
LRFTSTAWAWPSINQFSIPTGGIDYNEFLSVTMGSIQGLLLANFGAALGIKIAAPAAPVARALTLGIGAPPLEENAQISFNQISFKEKMQCLALIVYTIGLLTCFILWIALGCPTDSAEVVLIIPETAKTFVGVMVAYISVLMSS